MEVSLNPPSENLGGTLLLLSQLTLAEPSASESPLAPRSPGSILWEDRVSVTLEGSAARFPVEMIESTSRGRAVSPRRRDGTWIGRVTNSIVPYSAP